MNLEPGRYVIAVSGGVDSMALLELAAGLPDVRLTVAHYDHGIRPDSAEDRKLVQAAAKRLRLPFVYKEGRLGVGTSEARARKARYQFLREVQKAAAARAVITAHHQDDALETAVINIVRGTGRRGISALRDRHDTRRPLLGTPKANIQKYATSQGLVWREDSTNTDTTYLRNHIRHNVLPRVPPEAREELVGHIARLRRINHELDQALITQLHLQSRAGALDRAGFIVLPHDVAKELLMCWLREHGLGQFDRAAVERLVVGAKTLRPGKRMPVYAGKWLVVAPDHLILQ